MNDFADVLSAQTEQEIVELGRALQQQTGAQAVAVTVPSLGGQSVEIMPLTWQTAGALAGRGRQWRAHLDRRGGTKASRGSGAWARRSPAGWQNRRIMDEYMTPSLRQNDYSTGMLEGYKAVASQIYQEYGIEAQSFLVTRLPTTKILETDRIFPLC